MRTLSTLFSQVGAASHSDRSPGSDEPVAVDQAAADGLKIHSRRKRDLESNEPLHEGETPRCRDAVRSEGALVPRVSLSPSAPFGSASRELGLTAKVRSNAAAASQFFDVPGRPSV